MAFRDDNEALQAKVQSLQEELDEAKGTIAHLRGDESFPAPELLPKRRHGFARRVRVIEGHVEDDAFEAAERLLQSGLKAPMETQFAEGIFSATSPFFEVTIMPGESDQLFVVFDEAPATSYLPPALFFAFMSLGAVGGVQSGEVLGGLAAFLFGAVVAATWAYSYTQKIAKEQMRRDALFGDVVRFLERRTSSVRVSAESSTTGHEVEVPRVSSEKRSTRVAEND